jgi:F-type H+-transporting ATPase subunit b
MISIDGSLIIQIINFLFLIWILNKIAYKPIRNVLQKRKEKVAGLEKSIETSIDDAKQKAASFESGIKEARTKGLKEKESLLADAAEEEKRIVDKINQKAQADLKEVKAKIENDVELVKSNLAKEIDIFAKAIGQKILGRAF